MTKFQKILFTAILIISVSAGVYYKFSNQEQTFNGSLSDFNRDLSIQSELIDWEFTPSDFDTTAYKFVGHSFLLKADNTLSFGLTIPKAPVVIESIIGSQLGRRVLQIPFQTISQKTDLEIDGISMTKFNPFESINFLIIYEYDDGARARHTITFGID